MLDIAYIRENPKELDSRLASRGVAPCAEQLIEMDKKLKSIVTELQEIQNQRNSISADIGKAKSEGKDVSTLMSKVETLKSKMQELEQKERKHREALNLALMQLPNLPMKDVPIGEDEKSNKEIAKCGEASSNKTPEHFEIGASLGEMDFEIAGKISGARFVILRNQLARLERALANFMLDIHGNEFGYEECSVPLLVRKAALEGTGQLPKFGEDLFFTKEDFGLIPTAEVPLTNLIREQILEEEQLPLRFVAHTACFRSEAGAAGRDTRGMVRLHQFSKVELVSITTAKQGEEELERMRGAAEAILKRLNLSYRVVLLSTGDMGFSACKTYDLEVWLKGQQCYREISSLSLCGDFQARRMKARFRAKGEKKPQYVYTLNGSGLAIGRTLLAILEQNYQEDGSVAIPEALQSYMGGIKKLKPNKE